MNLTLKFARKCKEKLLKDSWLVMKKLCWIYKYQNQSNAENMH